MEYAKNVGKYFGEKIVALVKSWKLFFPDRNSAVVPWTEVIKRTARVSLVMVFLWDCLASVATTRICVFLKFFRRKCCVPMMILLRCLVFVSSWREQRTTTSFCSLFKSTSLTVIMSVCHFHLKHTMNYCMNDSIILIAQNPSSAFLSSCKTIVSISLDFQKIAVESIEEAKKGFLLRGSRQEQFLPLRAG